MCLARATRVVKRELDLLLNTCPQTNPILLIYELEAAVNEATARACLLQNSPLTAHDHLDAHLCRTRPAPDKRCQADTARQQCA